MPKHIKKNASHAAKTREKIQTTQLINVLTKHALDETFDLSPSRVKAIEILLRKTLPDLKQVEVMGEDGGDIRIDNKFTIEIVKSS